jgi:hypothetical protein
MFVAAGLFVIGSAVSWVGLRDDRHARAVEAARGAESPATTS